MHWVLSPADARLVLETLHNRTADLRTLPPAWAVPEKEAHLARLADDLAALARDARGRAGTPAGA